jgi:hypothetical protein
VVHTGGFLRWCMGACALTYSWHPFFLYAVEFKARWIDARSSHTVYVNHRTRPLHTC